MEKVNAVKKELTAIGNLGFVQFQGVSLMTLVSIQYQGIRICGDVPHGCPLSLILELGHISKDLLKPRRGD